MISSSSGEGSFSAFGDKERSTLSSSSTIRFFFLRDTMGTSSSAGADLAPLGLPLFEADKVFAVQAAREAEGVGTKKTSKGKTDRPPAGKGGKKDDKGGGEAKPKASKASATGRAENRRVEIMINQVSASPDDSTEVREMNLSR